MNQPTYEKAIQIQDKRHFDRTAKWILSQGINWRSPTATSDKIWNHVLESNTRVKALIVDVNDWTLTFADTEELDKDGLLHNWNFLSTADFKETIVSAAARRGLDDLPRSYRLKKDSAEILAGTIVEEVSSDGHYKVVNMDLRTFPEDSDYYFRQYGGICFSRKTVEEQPDWFERVYQLDQYVTEDEYVAIKEQLKNEK